jgi:hypothetical protein
MLFIFSFFIVLSPIENGASSKTDINYNNKYDPFPSLSSNNNKPNQVPTINIQKTFNQINKYSAFPSLEQSNTQRANTKPYDALFLDKYRKTKLW